MLFQSLACILFDLTVLLINKKIIIGNSPLAFLSTFSLELFLVHGFILNLIFDKVEAADYVLFALVFAVSIICAIILSPPDKWLTGHITRFLTREKKKLQPKALIPWIVSALLVLAAACAFFYGRHFLFARAEYDKEIKALISSEVGDEIEFGHFDTDLTLPGKESVTWIVIEKEDDHVCLLSKKGLGGSFYNQKHEEITWENSDIRKLINSKEYLNIFNRYEKEALMENNGDLISLMTPVQAESFFSSDLERELALTQAAEAKGTNINYLSKANYWDIKSYHSSWWWLKGPEKEADIYAPIVTVDGVIETGSKVVNKPSGAIRPLILVKIQ